MVIPERYSRLGGELIWIFLGQAGTVVGSLIGVRVLTEFLTPYDYGQLALGMTISSLVYTLVLGPLSNGAMRFFAPARERGALQTFLNAVIALTKKATAWILVIAFVVELLLAFGEYWDLVKIGLAAILFSIFSGYNMMLNGIQNAARQRSVVALHSGFSTWCRFLLASGFMFLLGSSSVVAMWGYAIAMVITLASQCYFFRKIKLTNSNEQCDKSVEEWKKQIIDYSWPFATWGIMSWFRASADRWGLEMFASTEDVGLYAVLFQLGYYPISMLIGMTTTLLSPIFFQRAGDATDPRRLNGIFRTGWRVAWFSIAILCFIVVVSFYLHEWIFSLLVAERYANISHLWPLMLLGAGIYESTRFFSIVLQTRNEIRILIVPTNVSHFVGIVLFLMGAAHSGVEGIVFALLIQAVFAFLWFAYIYKQQHCRLQTYNVNQEILHR